MWDEIYDPMTAEEIKDEIDFLISKDKDIQYFYGKLKVPIKIQDYGNGIRALYHVKNKEIWISPTKIAPGSLKEAFLHECIHSYDHNVNGIDLSSKKGLAKSEIHAMKLCECRNAWFKKRCTFKKAVQAVSLSIGSESEAKDLVSSQFEESYYENILNDPY